MLPVTSKEASLTPVRRCLGDRRHARVYFVPLFLSLFIIFSSVTRKCYVMCHIISTVGLVAISPPPRFIVFQTSKSYYVTIIHQTYHMCLSSEV